MKTVEKDLTNGYSDMWLALPHCQLCHHSMASLLQVLATWWGCMSSSATTASFGTLWHTCLVGCRRYDGCHFSDAVGGITEMAVHTGVMDILYCGRFVSYCWQYCWGQYERCHLPQQEFVIFCSGYCKNREYLFTQFSQFDGCLWLSIVYAYCCTKSTAWSVSYHLSWHHCCRNCHGNMH